MKTLTLTLDGPADALGQLVPLFARAHGWVEGSGQTAAEYARDVIAGFLRDSVTGQMVADAKLAAAAAATQQAVGAADLLTLTLTE